MENNILNLIVVIVILLEELEGEIYMSEKTFTFGAVSPNVAMIKYKGKPMNIDEVVNKLNEQLSIINRNKISMNTMISNMEKLEKENRELNSIKKFAEKNGINIFDIDTVFHNCWNDNANLVAKIKKQKDEINYWKNKYANVVKEVNRLFKEMKQPITINLTKEDEKELRKLLGLIDDE